MRKDQKAQRSLSNLALALTGEAESTRRRSSESTSDATNC